MDIEYKLYLVIATKFPIKIKNAPYIPKRDFVSLHNGSQYFPCDSEVEAAVVVDLGRMRVTRNILQPYSIIDGTNSWQTPAGRTNHYRDTLAGNQCPALLLWEDNFPEHILKEK